MTNETKKIMAAKKRAVDPDEVRKTNPLGISRTGRESIEQWTDVQSLPVPVSPNLSQTSYQCVYGEELVERNISILHFCVRCTKNN